MDTNNSSKPIEIVKSALKVFSKSGYHKGKMEDIAREAGVGKATLYHYYNSKDELFYQMLKYFIEDYLKNACEVIAKGISVRDKLTSLIENNLALISSRSEAIEQLFYNTESMSTNLKPLMMQMQKSMYNLIYGIVEEGIDTGELQSTLDKDIATLIIVGTINNICFNRVIHKKELTMTLDSSIVVNMLLLGLGNNQE